MTYSTVKPDAGPSPSLDVGQIKTNYSTYLTVFGRQHLTLNDPKMGQHKVITMQKQDDDLPVLKNSVVMYPKNVTSKVNTQPQLFFRIPKFLPNEVPNTPMQLTYNTVNTAGPVYQSFIPGGYLLFMGMVTDISFDITLPTDTNGILVAIAASNTVKGATRIQNTVYTKVLTTSSFKIGSNLATGTPYSFSYIVIARA